MSDNQEIDAELLVTVSELCCDPRGMIENAADKTIAVMKHDQVIAYLMPPALYERLIEILNDDELVRIIDGRKDQVAISVSLDDL